MRNWFGCAIPALLLLTGIASRAADGADAAAQEPKEQDMRLIPAGEFRMGSTDRPNEGPVHTVYLDAFHIDRCEVTNRQWKAFVDANPDWRRDRVDPRFHDGSYLAHWNGDSYPPDKAEHPVVYVSWFAAAAYARWAGKRLPTEAEWEKAARGPKQFRYAYGNEYDAGKANTGRSIEGTSAVGSYPENDYGLCDMTGNVMEWCADWFGYDYYASSPTRNPKGPAQGESRVMRGGSWNYFADRCTATFRFYLVPPDVHRACTDFIGFRCAMDAPAPTPRDTDAPR